MHHEEYENSELRYVSLTASQPSHGIMVSNKYGSGHSLGEIQMPLVIHERCYRTHSRLPTLAFSIIIIVTLATMASGGGQPPLQDLKGTAYQHSGGGQQTQDTKGNAHQQSGSQHHPQSSKGTTPTGTGQPSGSQEYKGTNPKGPGGKGPSKSSKDTKYKKVVSANNDQTPVLSVSNQYETVHHLQAMQKG